MRSRRSFLALTAAFGFIHRAEGASTKWKPGAHFTELSPPLALPGSDGKKVTVTEFFWYGCPHCYTLEPHLVLWHRRKPEYVEITRVPVAWYPVRVAHARLYHALRSLQREDLHGQIFDAIFRADNPTTVPEKLDTLQQQQKFLRARGIGEEIFAKAFNSAAVEEELRRSNALSRSYRIAGVPAIAINGKYTTDVGMAGGEDELIFLIQHLVEKEHEVTKS